MTRNNNTQEFRQRTNWIFISLREETERPALTMYEKCVPTLPQSSTSVTLPGPPPCPHPRNEILEIWIFKSSWTSDFKVQLYPPPPPMKIGQIWNFQVNLDFSFQSATLPLALRNESLVDLELLSQVYSKLAQVSLNPPPPPEMKIWKFWNFLSSQVRLQISKCLSLSPP